MALIEISVDSVESALAAQRGGAHRIELCSALREGGVTPSLGLIRAVRSTCALPVVVIVRPRGGDFLYTPAEFKVMQEDIRILQQEDVEGVAVGILTQDGRVDTNRVATLVELAGTMSFTFHRAFDMAADLSQALEDVIACGADRVLTSGGAQSATAGEERLRSLVQQAGERTAVVVGGGVRPRNIANLRASIGAKQFHASMRKLVPSPMLFRPLGLSLGAPGSDEFAKNLVSDEEVRALVQAAD